MSLGIGMIAASGGGSVAALPTVVYTGQGFLSGTTSGVTATVNLGVEAADRRIFLCSEQNNADTYVTARTLGGIELGKIAWDNLDSVRWQGILALDVPTGTSATLRYKTTGTGVSLVYKIYAVYGLISTVPFQKKTTGSGTTNSTTIDIPANGFALGSRRVGSGVNPKDMVTWTGLTRNAPASGDDVVQRALSSASFVTAAAVTGRAVSASATNYPGAMSVVSFGNGA